MFSQIEVKFLGKKFLEVFHRPPSNNSSFINAFEMFLSKVSLQAKSRLLILGDFNFPNIDSVGK